MKGERLLNFFRNHNKNVLNYIDLILFERYGEIK